MIEREILTDIKEYDPKFIGPLTLRQVVCIGGGSLLAVPAFFGLRQIFTDSASALMAIAIGLPFFICVKKPYGVPMEKFVIKLIKMFLLCPKERRYKCNNIIREELIKAPPDSEETTVLPLSRKPDQKQIKEIEKRRKEVARHDKKFEPLP